MPNRAAALHALADGVNHCSAFMPKVHASMAYPFEHRSDQSPVIDNDPCYRWLVNDYIDNGRIRRTRTLHIPRESDPNATSDAYFERLDDSLANDTTVQSGKYQYAAPTTTTIGDVLEDEALYFRAAAPDALNDEGLATMNGYQVMSMCVQDDWLYRLESSSHEFVEHRPKAGSPVLAEVLEKVRAKLHHLRTYQMPVVACWLAYAVDDVWATTAITAGTGGPTGVRTQSTTYVNMFDQAQTAWAATDPGFWVHGRYKGIGEENVRVRCEALMETDATSGAGGAQLRFDGPTAIASNTAEISIVDTDGLDWHGTASDVVHLDPTVANNVSSTSSPLIIPFIKTASGPTNLYVYGILCWLEYGA